MQRDLHQEEIMFSDNSCVILVFSMAICFVITCIYYTRTKQHGFNVVIVSLSTWVIGSLQGPSRTKETRFVVSHNLQNKNASELFE